MIFPGLAKGSYYKSTASKTDFNLSSYIVKILVDQNIISQDDVEGCCFTSRSVFIKKGLVGKGTILLKKQILRIIEYLGIIVSFECCNDSVRIFKTILDYQNIPGSLSLKSEIIRILDFFAISHGDVCCDIPNNISVPMMTFLGTDTPSYPVGVFNIDGDFVGIANDQDEYITVWNSDIDNQTQGILTAGANELTFNLPSTSTLSEIRGLRFYTYQGPNNMQIFVGDNDIVHYGTTIKKGSVDGILINTDTRREWNRNLYSGGAQKNKIPNDTVRTLTCTGYAGSSLMEVFHNEDSEYVAVSGSFGFYTITGNLPIGLKACFWSGRFGTLYNTDVLNWAELTSLFSWYSFSTGGTPWGMTPSEFPTPLFGSTLLTQLSVGQPVVTPTLLGDYGYITSANFPNLKDLLLHHNTDNFDTLFTAGAAWFLTMPKVTETLYINTQLSTQAVAATADAVWNNVATALNGVVPTGTVKELRINRTNNITAASLTSRNYLISQGWTIATN